MPSFKIFYCLDFPKISIHNPKHFRNFTDESYLIAEVKKVYTNDVLGLNIYKRGSLENLATLMIKKGLAKVVHSNKTQVSYRIPG